MGNIVEVRSCNFEQVDDESLGFRRGEDGIGHKIIG